LTIASRIGEPQPRLGLGRETPKKPSRTSAGDGSVLNEVCRTLEAAGLSVVVVVAVDATPGLTTNGHVARRARRSLEATGLSTVADESEGVGPCLLRRANKANLLLVKDEIEDVGPRNPRGRPQVGEPAGPVIVFTSSVDEKAARAALVTGGLGYMVKASTTAPVAGAWTLSRVNGVARHQMLPGSLNSSVDSGDLGHGLTSRELEVLQALATGASTIEVARELYVSPKTAKNHIAHIYAKLGVSSRTQAIAKALRQGIVSID
jgi:DNA-binding NarL/FixJ family response regulator